jgi:hypothetical protein
MQPEAVVAALLSLHNLKSVADLRCLSDIGAVRDCGLGYVSNETPGRFRVPRSCFEADHPQIAQITQIFRIKNLGLWSWVFGL